MGTRAHAGDAAVPDGPDLEDLLSRTARGDEAAFATFYDRTAARVYGLVLRVLRDRGHAEEVAQEVLVEVWRTASRFDRTRGSAIGWTMTLAHRRAVDRVRSTQAAGDRERRVAAASSDPDHDQVVDTVVDRLDQQAVRRCLRSLTGIQREAIDLAYYGGYTYREVAELLSVALPTVKTRIRDGLIRLRDCMGVS
ncbi:MAG: ECF RNA polymerase sigma factor SigK [Micromonosporaceae bacterium]